MVEFEKQGTEEILKTLNSYWFKISPNWGCVKTPNQLFVDAKFIFAWNGYKGRRPHIVLNTPIEGFDLVEIDYDRYGITTNGISKFDETWGDRITDSSKDCSRFIVDFLISEGAKDLIEDSYWNRK